MTIDPANLAQTATLTFDEEFTSLSLWNGSSGVWSTVQPWAEGANGYTLASNGEQEWYIDSTYAATSAVKPWTVSDGVLTITAAPASAEISALINGYSYTSGTITSYHSFSQTYGYFEMSAELPAGQGLWPAFWLLPADGSWPPELDIMEVLGDEITKLVTTAHSSTLADGQSAQATTVADLSAGFHTYGVDWEADKITWYFDGQAIYSIATPADMNKPMYILANLAVGGYWPGSPDSTTVFPAEMQIDYIRAYASISDVATGSTANSTAVVADAATSASVTDLSSASSAQTVTGAATNDWIQGGSAGDLLNGSDGADTINGRVGADTVWGGSGSDWLYGGKDGDQLSGDGGDDMVLANLGADTLDGGAGADTLRGGQGDDVIAGGDGADWLSGDRGSDTETGGAGADTFHLFGGSGVDVVLDFSVAQGDHVQVDAGLSWAVSQSGSDSVVLLSTGDELILSGVQLADLGSGWIFGA